MYIYIYIICVILFIRRVALEYCPPAWASWAAALFHTLAGLLSWTYFKNHSSEWECDVNLYVLLS